MSSLIYLSVRTVSWERIHQTENTNTHSACVSPKCVCAHSPAPLLIRAYNIGHDKWLWKIGNRLLCISVFPVPFLSSPSISNVVASIYVHFFLEFHHFLFHNLVVLISLCFIFFFCLLLCCFSVSPPPCGLSCFDKIIWVTQKPLPSTTQLTKKRSNPHSVLYTNLQQATGHTANTFSLKEIHVHFNHFSFL